VRLFFLERLESIKPFSEPEAWFIYKLAAFAEAIGWTLLIIAVVIRKYNLIGHSFVVVIAGRIHGTFFIAYFVILLVTYTSLNWSRQKFINAAIAGVPPYGSLVFEKWAAKKREDDQLRALLWSVYFF
jgi:integral membrane protein